MKSEIVVGTWNLKIIGWLYFLEDQKVCLKNAALSWWDSMSFWGAIVVQGNETLRVSSGKQVNKHGWLEIPTLLSCTVFPTVTVHDLDVFKSRKEYKSSKPFLDQFHKQSTQKHSSCPNSR